MNIYKENIIKKMDRQIAKGKHEYGMSLEENTSLSMAQRIDMASEELVDLLFYLQHIKATQEEQE